MTELQKLKYAHVAIVEAKFANTHTDSYLWWRSLMLATQYRIEGMI